MIEGTDPYPAVQQDEDSLRVASPRSLKKNSSVLEISFEKIREMQENGFPNNIRSCSIILGLSRDDIGFQRDDSL